MSNIVYLDNILEQRARARTRAKELIVFFTEKCAPNDAIPKNMKPYELEKEITEIFLESEHRQAIYKHFLNHHGRD